MFIWLTIPNVGRVIVNVALVTVVSRYEGKTTVNFVGGEGESIIVTETPEEIYEQIASMQSLLEEPPSRLFQ